jgi:hypothetical protein
MKNFLIFAGFNNQREIIKGKKTEKNRKNILFLGKNIQNRKWRETDWRFEERLFATPKMVEK